MLWKSEEALDFSVNNIFKQQYVKHSEIIQTSE